MLLDTQSSTLKTFSACERKENTYLLPLIRPYSVRLPCCWNFVLLSCSLVVPSLLWPRSCLGWFWYLIETPWIPGTFQPLPQTHTCSEWVSFSKSGGCRRSLWDHPNCHPPFGFLLACRQRRLRHSFQSDVQISCSWASVAPTFLRSNSITL